MYHIWDTANGMAVTHRHPDGIIVSGCAGSVCVPVPATLDRREGALVALERYDNMLDDYRELIAKYGKQAIKEIASFTGGGETAEVLAEEYLTRPKERPHYILVAEIEEGV